MSTALYHTHEGNPAAKIIGKSDRFTIDKSITLEKVVEAKVDLLQWSGGNGVAVFKDYVVIMDGDRMEGKRDLLIALRPQNHEWTEPIDATLKGLKVFKLSNTDKNLVGVNPVPLARTSTSPKLKKLLFASGGNTIATASEGLCRRFSLAELMSATNNFNDKFVIGSGGFGKVYKALIDDDATTVALKRCYCDERNEMILVYEFMEHGTLADHLYKTKTKGNDSRPKGRPTMADVVVRLEYALASERAVDEQFGENTQGRNRSKGNTNSQSKGILKRRDTEDWMRHCQLPEDLKLRVRRFVQNKRLATQRADEETILSRLPSDLRHDIQRHVRLDLVRRVCFRIL
ncbi:hypothetical protein RHGRI_028574 [Rhododendron griersonianum]|uniref:Protein kinase domain-containing protein n=1 Tax=Rhododendron griersonianum TaxID=479676 RepID=A0AAV6IJK0_9ERIC|nr:hypothetical protein RHGRI_028574 [Rhododendron griersonianum]